jgi:hypothetical protein
MRRWVVAIVVVVVAAAATAVVAFDVGLIVGGVGVLALLLTAAGSGYARVLRAAQEQGGRVREKGFFSSRNGSFWFVLGMLDPEHRASPGSRRWRGGRDRAGDETAEPPPGSR